MATVEEIRDIMQDEYPHLTPTIPEIGRVVKFPYYDPDELFVTLNTLEKTISFNPVTNQLTADYELAMIGADGIWQLTFAISNSDRINSNFSWEYVDSA